MSNIEYYDIQYVAERTKRHVGIESNSLIPLKNRLGPHSRHYKIICYKNEISIIYIFRHLHFII